MKTLSLAVCVLLAGCVSMEFPGIVSDAAKVSKDAYRSVVGPKDEGKPAAPPPAGADYLVHSYVGHDKQTLADIRQACVDEAAEKLRRIAGKDVAYSVTDNTIATLNNAVVANCRLTLTKPAVTAAPQK